jgi:hypothetical protein
MSFKAGEIPPGATPFKPGESGNPKGKPKGALNRNTIARRVLAMIATLPEDKELDLKKIAPKMPKKMTMEEVMTLVQVKKAIDGDNQSYKMLMDSGYGAPKQEIDMTSEGERINPTISIIHSTGKISLHTSEKDIIIEEGLTEDEPREK